jgi:hypothetical protein
LQAGAQLVSQSRQLANGKTQRDDFPVACFLLGSDHAFIFCIRLTILPELGYARAATSRKLTVIGALRPFFLLYRCS